MTRTPMIAGNWKMNTTLEEAISLIKTMQPGLHKIQGVEKVLCPPFISLIAAKAIIKGSSVKLGAQNVFYEEKGAYTGAHESFKGRFEIADGGTLFLDEVADIPFNIQVKLLRFIQEKEFQRLGSTQVIKSDVRIISATNFDIEQMVKENKFRADLYFRLNVIPIEVPPLRKRREDIPLLVNHFIFKHSQINKSRAKEISSEGLDLLIRYDYPGNVRELENIIERAVILARGSIITREDLPLDSSVSIGASLSKSLPDQVEELEITLIRKALQQSNGIQAKAAELLGITDRMLRYKLMKYNIQK